MSENITLDEYRNLASGLPGVQPFAKCCDKIMMKPAYVEPLEGRNTLEVDRTCILECEKCGKQYVSRWD